MIALKAIPMNNQESAERDEREVRYRDSQDDIAVIRRELNKLTSAVGEVVVAIKGNEFGSDGLVSRVKTIEDLADKLKARLDEWEVSAKANAKAWRIIYLLLGTVGGTVLKIIIDHIVPVKK